MGRKPTVHLSLPVRMRARVQKSGRTFYYFDTATVPRREIPLGSDYLLAVKKWSELMGKPAAKQTTFADVVEQYTARELVTLAEKTQREYKLAIKRLQAFFDGAPLDEIESTHVYQYGARHREHKVQAARDKATLSTIFEFARREGYTARPNPCAGVKFEGSKAQRKFYASDAVVRAVYDHAAPELQDAMDLAYLTGQRPQDVLTMSEGDIKDGALGVDQKKTGAVRWIVVEGRLKTVIGRCRKRKAACKVVVMALLTNEHGKPLTKTMLRDRFDDARTAAAAALPKLAADIKQFQFRDLRAKAGTDKAAAEGTVAAQNLLGHSKATTTDIYIRQRGLKVRPNK